MDRSPVFLNRLACASRRGIGPVPIDVRRADGFAAKDAINTGVCHATFGFKRRCMRRKSQR